MNPIINSSAAFGLSIFLYSLFLGAALGVVYTALALFASVCGFKALGRFFTDVLFWLIAALAVFLFCYAGSAGMVRGYVILGTGIGFGFYYILLGRFLTKFFDRISRKVDRLFAKAEHWIGKGATRIVKTTKKLPKLVKTRVRKPKKADNDANTH